MNSKNLHKHAVPVIMVVIGCLIGVTAITAVTGYSSNFSNSAAVSALLGSGIHLRPNRSGLATIGFKPDDVTANSDTSLQSASDLPATIATIFAFESASQFNQTSK